MRKTLVNFAGLFDNKEHILQVIDQFRNDIASSTGETSDYGYQYNYFATDVHSETNDPKLDDFVRVTVKNLPSQMPDDLAWYEFPQLDARGL